jgi:hypothetical protein
MGPAGTVASFVDANTEYLSNSSIFPNSDYRESFSVQAWARRSGTTNYSSVISDLNGRFFLYWNNASTNLVARLQGDQVTVSLASDLWHHLVLVFDKAAGNTRTLYIDGEATVITPVTSPTVGAALITVGAQSGGSLTHNGDISRCAVWEGAISASVVTSLYNSGKGKSYADLTTAEKVDLLSYWDLDEASGTRYDSHGSYDLTDNNTVGSTTNSYPANLQGRVAYFVSANSEYLSRADDLGVNWSGDLSIALWFNPSSVAAAFEIFSWVGDGMRLYFASGGQFQWYIEGLGRAFVNGAAVPGQWRLLVVTQKDEGAGVYTYKYSFDGDPLTSIAYTSGSTDATAIRVGRYGGSDLNFYPGALSTIAVWQRTLLDVDVTALYNSGNGTSLP